MENEKIPMEEEVLYEHQLDLLYCRSDQLKIQSDIIINEIKSKSTERNRFLDIGAGNGRLTEIIAPLFKETHCIEPHLKNAQYLAKKFDKVYNVYLQAFITPLKYDLILLSHVLYYIKRESWLRTIKDIFSSLEDKGIIILILQSKDGEVQKFFNKFANEVYDIDPIQFAEELTQFDYTIDVIHSSITMKSQVFEEFLELCFFFLLEKKSNLIKRERQITDYILNHFKKNSYFTMKQDIDFIFIYNKI